MDKFIGMVGAGVTTMAVLAFLPVLSAAFGAFAGLMVGLFFDTTILGILSQLGVTDVAMWQVGAFMGFMGGFLRTKVTAEVKDK